MIENMENPRGRSAIEGVGWGSIAIGMCEAEKSA